MKWIFKNGEFTPLKLEHGLILVLGICMVCFSDSVYTGLPSVGKLIILIIFLGLLIGIAPVAMPTFRSKFRQVVVAGFASALLDSFIVLMQLKNFKTTQEREEERIKFLVLCTFSALIGGLCLWFGEAYAAGLFQNDGRTGFLSALYIIPPVIIFLVILGWLGNRLKIDIELGYSKQNKRDVLEFFAGIILLIVTHNPLICLGWLLIYSAVTRQENHLLDSWKHHTEVNVMLVLIIALVGGEWLVSHIIEPSGFGSGEFLPIIPAGIQAVLWGPLYEDPSVHFWIRVCTLSTGAMLLPISSLVGVMLFTTGRQWWIYAKYSFPLAAVWFVIFRGWIWLTLDTPIGIFLEQWAHMGRH